jgi:histidinol-phosphate aminotransferase
VAALSPYVPGEQPTDPAVVKLNTNENPYPPSPAVTEALRDVTPNHLRRYPDPVSGALRKALARYHRCEAGQVFVANGSDEALALCVRAFVEDGGAVGYFDPSYSLYPVLTAAAGCEARPVPLGPGFGWHMPEDYTASLFFLANPNAPTGLLFPRETIRSFCAALDGVVVIDEAYVDFAREDCVELALRSDRVLVTRSFSKSYSLAGLRLGYALGATPLIEALDKVRDSYNVDAVTQRVGQAAIEDAAHMRRNAARIKGTRARVAEQLRGLGFDVADSQANFLWVGTGSGDASPICEALRARNVLVRHFPGPLTGPYFRVSIGTDEEMDRFLEALRAAVSCEMG